MIKIIDPIKKILGDIQRKCPYCDKEIASHKFVCNDKECIQLAEKSYGGEL